MLDWVDVEAATREADFPPVPDYAEPLQAWRLWAIEDAAGPARLRSLYHQRAVWPTGAAFVAHCNARRFRVWRRSPHEIPVGTCSCGIYGVRADRIRRLWRDSESPPGFSLVIGTVSLWGGVVECEHGWRAGFAYPRGIFVPSFAPKPDETAAELADYGAPVEVLNAWTIGMALDVVAERAA